MAVIGGSVAALAARSGSANDSHSQAHSALVVANDQRIFLSDRQKHDAARSGIWPVQIESLMNVRRPLKYGDFRWDERGVPDGPVAIQVDLRTQLISAFRGGHEIGSAVILYGADSHDTPLGRFPILSKAKDYKSRTYDAPMPYSLRLTRDGVAIHGSDVRWGTATHGCVGVPLEFAQRLFKVAEPGDQVLIVRSPEGKRVTHSG